MPHALEWTAEAREGGENLGLTLTSRVKHTCKSQARWPQAAAELNWNWKGGYKGGTEGETVRIGAGDTETCCKMQSEGTARAPGLALK